MGNAEIHHIITDSDSWNKDFCMEKFGVGRKKRVEREGTYTLKLTNKFKKFKCFGKTCHHVTRWFLLQTGAPQF